MKNLYLIRHAKSSWDQQGLRDFDRPLNGRGLETAPLMAQLLLRNGIKPDLLIASPAKRTLATARFFADAFGIDESEIRHEQDLYLPSTPELLYIIKNLPNDKHTIFLFGHNPGLTHLANMFTASYIDNVPTCGVVHIQAEINSWENLSEASGAVARTYFPKNELR